jgi:hypothetical protein
MYLPSGTDLTYANGITRYCACPSHVVLHLDTTPPIERGESGSSHVSWTLGELRAFMFSQKGASSAKFSSSKVKVWRSYARKTFDGSPHNLQDHKITNGYLEEAYQREPAHRIEHQTSKDHTCPEISDKAQN